MAIREATTLRVAVNRLPRTVAERRFLRAAWLVPVASLWFLCLFLWPILGLGILGGGLLLFLLIGRPSDLVFLLLVVVAAAVMVNRGLIRFTFFEQAFSLLKLGANPLDLLLSSNLWGPRYLLAYPAVMLSQWLDLDINLAFTIWGMFSMTVVIMLTVKYCDTAGFFGTSSVHRFIAQFVVACFWLSVSCFMNGRQMNSFLGTTLIAYGQVSALRGRKLGPRSILLQSVGVFLALMSSGTAVVGSTQFLLGTLLINRNLPKEGRLHRSAAFPLALVSGSLVVPFVYQGLIKSRDFYESDYLDMLTHGAGALFFLEGTITVQVALLLLLMTLGFVLLGRRLTRDNPYLMPACLLLPLSVFMGLYGYAMMTMALPALLVLGIYGASHLGVVVTDRGAMTPPNLPSKWKTISRTSS